MKTLYKANDRGVSRLDWLDTRYSFSFADWHDPDRMGFRSLRVLNEDRIAPGTGFGRHSHRDMEIVTVVLGGALRHEDSSGGSAVLRAGDVQRMTAGRGVAHSEYNASNEEELHLLQIWILPQTRGATPSHADVRGLFPVDAEAKAGLRALATAAGAGGELEIQQDAAIYAGRVTASAGLRHEIAAGRGVWIQAVRGSLIANGVALAPGDGLALEDEAGVEVRADATADFLLFDLA